MWLFLNITGGHPITVNSRWIQSISIGNKGGASLRMGMSSAPIEVEESFDDISRALNVQDLNPSNNDE
ncbi:MAG: hypothetical protein ACR2QF_15135 [Geminicoccaceae bacterium]